MIPSALCSLLLLYRGSLRLGRLNSKLRRTNCRISISLSTLRTPLRHKWLEFSCHPIRKAGTLSPQLLHPNCLPKRLPCPDELSYWLGGLIRARRCRCTHVAFACRNMQQPSLSLSSSPVTIALIMAENFGECPPKSRHGLLISSPGFGFKKCRVFFGAFNNFILDKRQTLD